MTLLADIVASELSSINSVAIDSYCRMTIHGCKNVDIVIITVIFMLQF